MEANGSKPVILIKNGRVIDPANGVDAKLNLLIADGKIADITREEPDCGCVIDAAGKCVTPGFIDIHMHEEGLDISTGKIRDSINLAMLRMGVTTALGGNCGENYMDPADYLDDLDRNGGWINMAMMAGHGYFRQKAGHRDKYTPLTETELTGTTALLQEALDSGCMGVSFGIRYIPGIDERELAACVSLCRSSGGLVSAHIRDDAQHVFGALEEIIQVCEKFDVPLQVSHIGSMGGFGQMKEVLEMIGLCRERQLDVTADCYPYYAFSTGIGETTYDDGFLERYGTEYAAIEICEGAYQGQRCTPELFRQLRQDAPQTLTICHVMKPEDVDLALMDPAVMIASDGLLNRGQGHPRAAGTFPRFIRNYVRTGRISLYDAVNKMTTLPAAKLGLTGKGRLNKGADADLVIFDPEKIEDRATFEHPTAAPAGIDEVLIGGRIALRGGEAVNGRLGRAVRRASI